MKLPRQLLPSWIRYLSLALIVPATLVGGIASSWQIARGQSTTADTNRYLTLRADVQEANSQTGVLTARGHVQIYYPAKDIQATAAQAQYFSKERRIVLSGNVYILQHGNSIRGETVTYLIDQGQFIALPQPERQVESIYVVAQPSNQASPQSSAAPATPALKPQPSSK